MAALSQGVFKESCCYSPRGTSADMLSVTVGDRGVALVKKLRYLRAKVSWTGSFISIVTWKTTSQVRPL